MAYIRKSILVQAPLDEVYELARDPRRWNTWWVGLGEPEEVNGNGEAGTIVKHHYTMAGVTFAVTSRVIEDKRTAKEAHWKGDIEGPLSGTHEWTYKAKGDKTEVDMMIDYTVPGKALGRIADRLLVEKLQEKAIETTLENLRLLCEAAVHA